MHGFRMEEKLKQTIQMGLPGNVCRVVWTIALSAALVSIPWESDQIPLWVTISRGGGSGTAPWIIRFPRTLFSPVFYCPRPSLGHIASFCWEVWIEKTLSILYQIQPGSVCVWEDGWYHTLHGAHFSPRGLIVLLIQPKLTQPACMAVWDHRIKMFCSPLCPQNRPSAPDT